MALFPTAPGRICDRTEGADVLFRGLAVRPSSGLVREPQPRLRSEAALARGDCSTTYAAADDYPGVPERVAATLPDVKLIYLVRDPLARMRSQYAHSPHHGLERRTFEQGVRHDARLVNRSRYGWHLDLYTAVIPRSRILVVSSEHLRSRRAETLGKIFGFLGVSNLPLDRQIQKECNRYAHTTPSPVSGASPPRDRTSGGAGCCAGDGRGPDAAARPDRPGPVCGRRGVRERDLGAGPRPVTRHCRQAGVRELGVGSVKPSDTGVTASLGRDRLVSFSRPG